MSVITSTSSYSARKRALSSSNKLLNHLRSIVVDWELLTEVREFLAQAGIPCVGNSRNGLWYAPEFDGGTCYFKSSDGHHGQWHFSLQRLNLDVATVALQSGGAIIVDSTKAGKRYPDSFSVTVPIWSAVLNYVVMKRGATSRDQDRGVMEECLCTPDWIISESSRDQIINFCLDAAHSLPKAVVDLIYSTCVAAQGDPAEAFKPLRPVWVCPNEDGSIQWEGEYADDLMTLTLDSLGGGAFPFTPIVLLSVSGARNSVNYGGLSVLEENTHESLYSYVYIRGAGDDEETWAQGLTPRLFWDHRHSLLPSPSDDEEQSPYGRGGCSSSNQDLEARVAALLKQEKEGREQKYESGFMTKVTDKLSLASSSHFSSISSSSNGEKPLGESFDFDDRKDGEKVVIINVINAGRCTKGREAVRVRDTTSACSGEMEVEVCLSCDKHDRRHHPGRWGKVLRICNDLIMTATSPSTPPDKDKQSSPHQSGNSNNNYCCRDVLVRYSDATKDDCEVAASLVTGLLCSIPALATAKAEAEAGTGIVIAVGKEKEEGEDNGIKSDVRVTLGIVQAAISRGRAPYFPHPPRWVVREISEYVTIARERTRTERP